MQTHNSNELLSQISLQVVLDSFKSMRIQVTRQSLEPSEMAIEFAVAFARFFNDVKTRLDRVNSVPVSAALIEWLMQQQAEIDLVRRSLIDVLKVCTEIALCDTSDADMQSLLSTMVGTILPFLHVLASHDTFRAFLNDALTEAFSHISTSSE